jgi:GT2 family glycosyltransferase
MGPPSSSRPIDGAIAAIVVTYRSGPDLRACLERLAEDPDVGEIVVVDNGNPAEVEAWLEGFAADGKARVLRGHGNVGFGAACNRGAAATAASYLLFVNPDLTLAPGAARRMRSALIELPAPAIVGGRILGLDGKEQRGARREEITPWSALVAAFSLGRFERFNRHFRDPHRERDPLPPSPSAVAAVSGALFLMSREDYAAVGGFDEGYFLHVEDIDLCRRARAEGGAVLFHPGAEGVHVGATSDASKLFVEQAKARSFTRYFQKFATTPGARAWAAVAAMILWAGFTMRGVVGSAQRAAAAAR